jgi:hypothetical protein
VAVVTNSKHLLPRRAVLAGLLGLGGGAALAACRAGTGALTGAAAINSAEATPPASRRARSFALHATPVRVDLGGTVVDTWAYGDTSAAWMNSFTRRAWATRRAATTRIGADRRDGVLCSRGGRPRPLVARPRWPILVV